MRRMSFALALVIGVFGLSPAPAHADQSCPADKACLWKDADSSGCRYITRGAQPDFRNQMFDDCPGQTINDQVSSIFIPDGSYATFLTLWTDLNYKGKFFCAYPGKRVNVPKDFNDKFSSIEVNINRPSEHCL